MQIRANLCKKEDGQAVAEAKGFINIMKLIKLKLKKEKHEIPVFEMFVVFLSKSNSAGNFKVEH